MENKSPQISVVIPVYNVAKYLKKCLDSILNQTFKDIEIICINDGSTDSSLDILYEYAKNDARFIVISQQCKGPSVSRNKGVELSKGEYVAFIDSDDYLLSEDYLEKMYKACKKYDADIAVASIVRGRNNKDAKKILNIDTERFASDYKEKLQICDVPNSNYVWNKLYRRSALVESGVKFPEGILYEDVWFTPKILYYLKTVVSVPDVVYFYRKRSGSIIKIQSKKAHKDYILVEEEMFRFFEQHNVDVSEKRKIVKKYKIFGLTVFKTITQCGKTKNILFNAFKW